MFFHRSSVIHAVLVLVLLTIGCSASYKEAAQDSYVGTESIQAVSGANYARLQADGPGPRQTVTTPAPDPGEASKLEPEKIGKKLIRNASLTVVVKKEKLVTPTVEQIATIADALDGYVARKSNNSISFKVPAGRLDEALAGMRELGQLKRSDISTVDVTSQYVDLAIRIENLKALHVRLHELAKQGKDVKEILEVEKELARVTTELEALEGQMRLMSNQTTYATINVYVQKRSRPGPIGYVFYGIYRGIKWLFVWD